MDGRNTINPKLSGRGHSSQECLTACADKKDGAVFLPVGHDGLYYKKKHKEDGSFLDEED